MDNQINDRERYLDLLEKTLTFSLWPEPLRSIEYSAKGFLHWRIVKAADRFLRRTLGARLAIEKYINREVGIEWPVMAHTMVGRKRLQNIRQLCALVDVLGIPGTFVECGVWRGGASMFARACLKPERQVICCDSFQGLPFDPSEPHWNEFEILKVSLDEVKANFDSYGLNHNVRFVEGWFSETLPKLNTQIAILRCDGDMYSSTIQILANLYPHVSPGGFCIIDDWNIPSCRRAVEDFRKLDQEAATIVDIDGMAVYWQKPTS